MVLFAAFSVGQALVYVGSDPIFMPQTFRKETVASAAMNCKQNECLHLTTASFT